jgi:hypothetical protein
VGELSSLNIFSNIPTAGALSAFDATFNLSNGTVTSVLNGGTATITLVGNGWYRCTVTNTVGTGSAANVQFRLVSGGNTTYVGTGQGLFLWAGQCEAGAFATTYIPTTTAAVTRAADAASLAISGLVYPLSVVVGWRRSYDVGSAQIIAQVDAGSNSQRAYFVVNSSDLFSAVTNGGGSVTVAGSTAVGTDYVGAARITLNDVRAARGGTLGAADTSATNPNTPTTLRIGGESGGTYLGGTVAKFFVYPNLAFSDAQLQSLSV